MYIIKHENNFSKKTEIEKIIDKYISKTKINNPSIIVNDDFLKSFISLLYNNLISGNYDTKCDIFIGRRPSYNSEISVVKYYQSYNDAYIFDEEEEKDYEYTYTDPEYDDKDRDYTFDEFKEDTKDFFTIEISKNFITYRLRKENDLLHVNDYTIEKKIGILDDILEYPNPLTNLLYSDNYKRLMKSWTSLPAYEYRFKILEKIKNNRVILCSFGTGSGKTVLVPKLALHFLNYKGKIAITLPKQIVAQSAAEYSAATLDVKLGDLVGYQYKGKSIKSNNTKLLYATDGTIVQMLLNDPYLREYDMVIIDEAHERKIQIDFLLYLLRETLKLRDDFKIIIMSATVNENIFKEYYNDFSFETIDIGTKPNYPIESIYLEEDIGDDYLEKGFEIIKEINKKNKEGDIIFFVPTVNETENVCEKFKEDSLLDDNFCIEVYSGISEYKKELATDKDKFRETGKKRKVVIATNVAESSITIDNLVFCIDSGLELKSGYDVKYDGKVLNKQFVTKAQIKQRIGRTGRTQKGVCYHLYTKELYNLLQEFPVPEIKCSDISDNCLKLLSQKDIQTVMKLKNILNNFIEPPPLININKAIEKLQSYRLIYNDNITQLGRFIVDLSGLQYNYILTIMYSSMYNVFFHVIDIISMIEACKESISNIFINSKNQYLKMKIQEAKARFSHKEGDHLSILNICIGLNNHLQRGYDVKSFCQENYMKIKTIGDYLNNRKKNIDRFKYKVNGKIVSPLLGYNRNINQNLNDEYKVLYCFTKGFIRNLAINNGKRGLKLISGEDIGENKISPDSFLSNIINVDMHFYNQLFINNNKLNLNILSNIPTKIRTYINEI